MRSTREIVKAGSTPEFYIGERCFIAELLNASDIPGVSVARARVTPGMTTELHSLGAIEIYFILEGEGRVEIGDEPPEFVKPGDLAYIAEGRPQRITNTGPIDLIFLCICTPRFRPEIYQSLEGNR